MALNKATKQRISIAFKMAEKVNRILSVNNSPVLTSSVERVVSEITNTKIIIRPLSFKALLTDNDIIKNTDYKSIGAMMGLKKSGDANYASIYINSDNDELAQRFSIVHELGHLITDAPNYIVGNNFTLSTHVNSDITLLENDKLEEDDFLINEQVANIFALLVLIPDEISVSKIAQIGCTELANKYKVKKEAIMSRMILGLDEYGAD